MTDTYLMPLAVRLASERVRADAANTMRHHGTSDPGNRLMCCVGVQDLGLVMAWVDQFAGTPSPSVEGEVVEADDDAFGFALYRAFWERNGIPAGEQEAWKDEAPAIRKMWTAIAADARSALSRARGTLTGDQDNG